MAQSATTLAESRLHVFSGHEFPLREFSSGEYEDERYGGDGEGFDEKEARGAPELDEPYGLKGFAAPGMRLAANIMPQYRLNDIFNPPVPANVTTTIAESAAKNVTGETDSARGNTTP